MEVDEVGKAWDKAFAKKDDEEKKAWEEALMSDSDDSDTTDDSTDSTDQIHNEEREAETQKLIPKLQKMVIFCHSYYRS